MKILIADDDPFMRNLIRTILEDYDHDFYEADNGVSAYESIMREGIQILISDWMMPEMTGIELCRKIRENPDRHYVYIILVTAKSEKADVISGLQSGADDFICKPLFAPELKARLNTSLRLIDLQNKYNEASLQLLQSDKMASIGQLAAGVAHEINNPTGFVHSNLSTMNQYMKEFRILIKKYHELMDMFDKGSELKKIVSDIKTCEEKIDINFILEDSIELIQDCQEGTERIKKIVKDLEDFSHPGKDSLTHADINKGLDSTLNVIWNEIKLKAKVIKNYSTLPSVECFPQQINQVFMNILVNASQAIEDMGEIQITTTSNTDTVTVTIQDSGRGIKDANLSRIFDPFFTTKDIGTGTGLGLNLAYKIIEKHQGHIDVKSNEEKGTEFIITLPVTQNKKDL